MVMNGHNMGGWTSIFTCMGDQDIFKVCLAQDPVLFHKADEIQNNQIDLKIPT